MYSCKNACARAQTLWIVCPRRVWTVFTASTSHTMHSVSILVFIVALFPRLLKTTGCIVLMERVHSFTALSRKQSKPTWTEPVANSVDAQYWCFESASRVDGSLFWCPGMNQECAQKWESHRSCQKILCTVMPRAAALRGLEFCHRRRAVFHVARAAWQGRLGARNAFAKQSAK